MSEVKTEEKAEAKRVRVVAVLAEKVAPPAISKRRLAMPAKEVKPNTVRGKMAYYQSAVLEMPAGVRAIQLGIQEQMNENKEAVATMQTLIKEQIKENLEYVQKFYG